MEFQGGKIARFGVYEVDLASAELRKQGTLLRLQEQPFQVLCALLQQPGQVVSREDLIRRLWADGTVVDFDRGLNAAVTRLRQVLSDSAESPRYIETVARRGYRFIAPVEIPAEANSNALPPVNSPKARIDRRLAFVAAIVLLAAPAVWWVYSGRSTPANSEPVKLTPLTPEPGNKTNVTFSPDGNQIVYIWQKDSTEEPHVYIRQVGVGDPVRFTKALEGEYSPAWSPDGRSIAFLRVIDAQRLALIVAPALGAGPERKLCELTSPEPNYRRTASLGSSIAWAPNGKYLIVAAYEDGMSASPPDSLTGLKRISTETGEQNWIFPPPPSLADGASTSPAVSPDGRTLAFSRSSSLYRREIFLQPLAADSVPVGRPFRLTDRPVVDLGWTRDGKEILFASAGWIYRVAARSGATPEIIHSLGSKLRMPVAGPSGRLAVTHITSDSNVWALELPSGRSTRLIASTAAEFGAEYSPDGRRIALQSERSGTPQIWVCESDGTRCVQLTDMKGVTGSPRWSPDGTQLTFDSNSRDGNFDIYTVSAGGGAPRRLTSNPADDAAPSWSRDGGWIYFFSNRAGRGEVWKIPSTGGTEIQVTRNGGMVAIESFDGKRLYYSRGDGETDLFQSNPDGTGEFKVLNSVAGRCFAVTRDRIYYLRHEKRGSALRSYVIASGADTLVLNIPKQVQNGLAVSLDGRTVIYAQIDSQESDLVMMEGFK